MALRDWVGRYLQIYKLGLKKAVEPHKPVIVVGNLVVGGAGKSPLILHLAKTLRALGFEVVIGCSGYGSPRAEAATMAPGGPLSAAEWGDEPAMFRWILPDVPLVVGRRRVLASELVHVWKPDAVLLMDDGFQHLPLKKHVSIVIDEEAPKNARCLPAGPYREPRLNRARADLLLPGGYTVVAGEMRLSNTHGLPIEVRRATVICALGRPDKFLAALSEIVEVVDPLVLNDHDPLTEGTLLTRMPADLPVIVTAKDWVKLRERPDVETRTFIIALQDVAIEPTIEFRTWLTSKLTK